MKDKISAFAFISLIIAILGVILPIAWDYYSGQKGISLTLMSQNQLISASTGVEGIEISYKGTKLTALSKVVFLIENTGSKPILQSEVVSPVKITVSENANILDAMVDSKVPNNIDFFVKKSPKDVVIDFSLFNPGDKAFVSLLISSPESNFISSPESNFFATARIAGVKGLDVNYEPPKTFTIWTIVWIPVILISLVLILVSFVVFSEYPQEVRVKRSIKNGSFVIPEFESYKEAHEWVKKNTVFMTSTERKPIFVLLKELEETNSGFNKDKILKSVSDAVIESENNFVIALIVFFIGFFGLYYALSSMGYL